MYCAIFASHCCSFQSQQLNVHRKMGGASKAGDLVFKAAAAGLGVATIYLTATFSVNVYRGLSWHKAQSVSSTIPYQTLYIWLLVVLFFDWKANCVISICNIIFFFFFAKIFRSIYSSNLDLSLCSFHLMVKYTPKVSRIS